MAAATFVETFYSSHLLNMTKSSLAILIFIGTVSYGQNKSSNKTFGTTAKEHLLFDTSKMAILPIDTSDHWLFNGANPLQLTNQDLKSVDKIFNDCIQIHNSKQDTTKEFNEFIDLKKYKIQYVPFISSNGQKKVYINAFCNYYWNFESTGWKRHLIEVKDGGSCFFHLTINLTDNNYEEFYTNGYG